MLSGFLISSILLRCRQSATPWHSLRAFYARRFLRIFPLYYMALAAGVTVGIPSVRDGLLWHVTYLSNVYFFVSHAGLSEVSHLWSLAVEEQFYLCWPLVLLFMLERFMLRTIAGLVIVGTLSRVLLPFLSLATVEQPVPTISSVDALGLGGLLALVKARVGGGDRPGVLRASRALSAIGLPFFVLSVGMLEAGVPVPFQAQLMHVAVLCGCFWLVDRASDGFSGVCGRLLTLPVLLFLGRISYGLYLLHNVAAVPVGVAANALGLPLLPFGAELALKAVVTILGATLSWHFLESPLNSLKRHFPYAPAGRRELAREAGRAGRPVLPDFAIRG